MRLFRPVLLLVLAVILVAALIVSAAPTSLEKLGVIVPVEKPHGNAKLVMDSIVYVEASVDGGRVSLWASRGSVLPSGMPGGPALPALEYLVRLPPGYRAVVSVEPLSFHVIDVDVSRLAKLPPLFAFYARRQVMKPGPAILENAVFPAILYTHYTIVKGGERFERIVVYPVQYSRGRLVIIDAFRLRVWLEPLKVSSMPVKEGKPVVLVLARNYTLAKFAASLVSRVHPDAVVYAAGLENVTRLGIMLPLQVNISGVLSPPSSLPPLPLLFGYNYTLAALIRGYVAWAHEHLGVNYLLIIGGARDVPPSYYYFSPLEYFYVGLYNAWIPTDYFYADLDMNFVPDVYVGRIPFSDPHLLEMYFEKVAAYQEYQKEPTVLVIGSHPFNTAPPVAEAMMATYTVRLKAFKGLEPDFMTRILGNYTVKSFRSLFLNESQPAWILVIAHGLGSIWADYFYNKTLGEITPVLLLTSRDILSKSVKRDRLGIVTSVACINGAWDTDLVPPAFPLGVSIGEAIVASWGGVAYVGHSRVAFDWVAAPPVFNVTNGTVIANFGGTTLLHGYFIKAWSEGARTLGEAVWRGAVMYLSDRYAGVIPDEAPIPVVSVRNTLPLSLVTVLEVELLGDPLIRLPAPRVQHGAEGGYARITGTPISVNASVAYGPLVIVGRIPAFKPISYEYLMLEAKGLRAARLAVVKNFLDELEALMSVAPLRPGSRVHLGGVLTGNLLVGAEVGNGYLLLPALAAGVGARYENGVLRVKVWSLNLISAPFSPVFVYVDNNLVRVVYNASGEVSIPYSKPGVHVVYAAPLKPLYSVLMSVLNPGKASLQVTPSSLERLFTETLQTLYSSRVSVRTREALDVSIGALLVTGSTLRVPVRVTLRGSPVNASVEASLDGKPVKVYRNATGLYTIIAGGVKPGTHLLMVRAEYDTRFVSARGTVAASIVVDENVAKAIRVIRDVNSTLVLKLGSTAETLEERIRSAAKDVKAAVESSLGRLGEELNGKLDRISTELATSFKKLGSMLASAESRIESSIKSSVDEGVKTLSGEIKSVKEDIVSAFSSKIEELGSKISADINKVNAMLSELKSTVSSGMSTIEQKISGLSAEVKKRVSALESNQVATMGVAVATLIAVIASAVVLGVRRG